MRSHNPTLCLLDQVHGIPSIKQHRSCLFLDVSNRVRCTVQWDFGATSLSQFKWRQLDKSSTIFEVARLETPYGLTMCLIAVNVLIFQFELHSDIIV